MQTTKTGYSHNGCMGLIINATKVIMYKITVSQCSESQDANPPKQHHVNNISNVSFHDNGKIKKFKC